MYERYTTVMAYFAKIKRGVKVFGSRFCIFDSFRAKREIENVL